MKECHKPVTEKLRLGELHGLRDPSSAKMPNLCYNLLLQNTLALNFFPIVIK